ncbi:MAG: hypothetical protein JWM98_1662 [Thermoleophilia bacterium]|nr:hypothetical protein [Thermoleophilia bacterium]
MTSITASCCTTMPEPAAPTSDTAPLQEALTELQSAVTDGTQVAPPVDLEAPSLVDVLRELERSIAQLDEAVRGAGLAPATRAGDEQHGASLVGGETDGQGGSAVGSCAMGAAAITPDPLG